MRGNIFENAYDKNSFVFRYRDKIYDNLLPCQGNRFVIIKNQWSQITRWHERGNPFFYNLLLFFGKHIIDTMAEEQRLVNPKELYGCTVCHDYPAFMVQLNHPFSHVCQYDIPMSFANQEFCCHLPRIEVFHSLYGASVTNS